MQPQSRRTFLQTSAAASAALVAPAAFGASSAEPPFKISLAQWSLNRQFFGRQQYKGDKLDNLDFAKVAKNDFGIDAIEYVNQFFRDKVAQKGYVAEMKKRADGEGVKSLLIMVDGEGKLGDPSLVKRAKAVENHYKWVDAAKQLGCHSIRVNAGSAGSYEDQMHRAADGLRALTEFAAKSGLNVIVENHGGLSSNGQWLAATIKKVDHPRCGTLPDFGNFRVSNKEMYDRYKGVTELMPFAKAVSAKSHDFDGDGNETHTDYFKMMKIVAEAGYKGYVGIEYEGRKMAAPEGIMATKKLLERVAEKMA